MIDKHIYFDYDTVSEIEEYSKKHSISFTKFVRLLVKKSLKVENEKEQFERMEEKYVLILANGNIVITKNEIDKINMELSILQSKKSKYEKHQENDTTFGRCKNSVLDYLSFKNPTKEQVKRFINKIKIDKDKKVYVHLKFSEILVDN